MRDEENRGPGLLGVREERLTCGLLRFREERVGSQDPWVAEKTGDGSESPGSLREKETRGRMEFWVQRKEEA